VLTLLPRGIISTPMMDQVDTIMGKRYGDPGAMARRGDPEEVAQVIAFLVGEESSFVSGMVYGVDGGWAC
jgi:NAD(P)-dependent dehydrogenase (short-subunit alcohol dehydrogenase family)